MIVGDPGSFAIESSITQAVPSVSQRALGYFIIHLAGTSFGVRDQSASMLGCSFNEIEQRLKRRGAHRMERLSDIDALNIANGFLDARYRESSRTSYFSLLQSEFIDAIFRHNISWAPDGDAAFDDGSHILHFDFDKKVRLIGFRNTESPTDVNETVRDVWINADLFYDILSKWHGMFVTEWRARLRA